MMLARTAPDNSPEAALARLTPKERESLEGWLGHKTAKEIALDLGVSHHAIEKRLKSARAKLGVTTTLEAARMLAAAGYGPTASGPPEDVAGGNGGQSEEADRADASPIGARRRWIIAGVTVMSLILLIAFAISAQQATTPAPNPPRVQTFDMRNGNRIDPTNVFAGIFTKLDKNSDGVLDSSESEHGFFKIQRTSTGKAPTTSESSAAAFDTDKNGLVTRLEFEAGFAALTTKRSS